MTAALPGLGLLLSALGGCAGTMGVLKSDATAATPSPGVATRRALQGGFLNPALAPAGQPTNSTGAVFVRFQVPGAFALKGQDLVVVDQGLGRVWRMDVMAGTVTGMAGAPAHAAVRVALGPDLSAWLLDGTSSRLLRYARDGRLLQTIALNVPLHPTARVALADAGTTVLVPGAAGVPWFEVRGMSGFAEERSPRSTSGERLDGRVDAIAVMTGPGARLALLDGAAGRVTIARRDGSVESQLGAGVLKQPFAIGVDRWQRILVADAFDHAIRVFSAQGALLETMSRERLGVAALGEIGVDDGLMVVADRVSGQLQLHVLAPPQAGPEPAPTGSRP